MNPAPYIAQHVANARKARREARQHTGFQAQMRRNYAGHEMRKARHLKQLGDRCLPTDEWRYPPDCPDADFCAGNRICMWRCQDSGEGDDE